jgi:predicted chitinase
VVQFLVTISIIINGCRTGLEERRRYSARAKAAFA